MSEMKARDLWALIMTGFGGVLLLFGIGNFVGLEWPDWLTLPALQWPVWALVLVALGTIIGLLVLVFLLSFLLIFENPFPRILYAILVCAICALEAGVLGIDFEGFPIWEGGIPNVPFWAAVLMTVFGGILAFLGFGGIVFPED